MELGVKRDDGYRCTACADAEADTPGGRGVCEHDDFERLWGVPFQLRQAARRVNHLKKDIK